LDSCGRFVVRRRLKFDAKATRFWVGKAASRHHGAFDRRKRSEGAIDMRGVVVLLAFAACLGWIAGHGSPSRPMGETGEPMVERTPRLTEG
jgi:hypothetical protein